MSNENKQNLKSTSIDFEYINVYQIILYFWKSKFIFIILLFLSFFYSSYVLKNSDFVFEVRLDVIPLNETSNIGSSSISTINQILGISSNQTDTQLSLYKSLIKSSSIAQILANDIDFVKKLAGESWDSKIIQLEKAKKQV